MKPYSASPQPQVPVYLCFFAPINDRSSTFKCWGLVSIPTLSPLVFRQRIPLPPPPRMVQGPPSSDSESDAPDVVQEYQYESEGDEMLGNRARTLLREARGDYRCKHSLRLN